MRNNSSSKSVPKDWNDEKHQRSIKKVPGIYKESKCKLSDQIFLKQNGGWCRPLNKETIALLKAKHPLEKAASEETKLHGLLPTIKNMIFDIIVNSMVLEATKTTEEGCGSSRMGADGWRRILISRDYGDASNNLREAKASRINKIDIEEINYLSLSTLMASRLV